MNRKGSPHFSGYSGGSHPIGIVNPHALRELSSARLPTEGLRSKSWDEFSRQSARISLLIALPLETLERDVVQREVNDIGRS